MGVRFNGDRAKAKAYIDGLRYIPARWQYGYRGNVTLWVGLHAMVSPETTSMAEDCAEYFRTTDRQASTQFCVDNDSTIRSAGLDQIVAGAVGGNHKGVHIEQAGNADENDWTDAYSQQMVREQTAPLVAALCLIYDLPIERVDAAGARAGRKGIVDHEALWRAFGGDVRSDPGDAYPWDLLLTEARLVRDGSTTPTPEHKDWFDMATKEELAQLFTEQDARIDATIGKQLDAILVNVDPVGVAAGTPGQGPSYLRTEVGTILALARVGDGGGSVNPAALAELIADELGPDLARKLADELAARLAA